ncbi:unnamed protein product [Taenia asiatica]|uniref:Secreted protein n=1 Tax=Taenia asiatica TaxID=60517 RepID=A0A0R3WFB3_TAEAS|nr:unnamed protein product [Taenia asiatica]
MLQVPRTLHVAFACLSVPVKELSRQRYLLLVYGHLAQRLAALVDGGVSSDSCIYCCQKRLLRKSAEDRRNSLPLRIRI